ncbi:Arylsulfatase precursor [Rubripirellula lacrimiformis]|uniref:Arylsulfatase n=1 Tax=Rubripirellula lacrimiformis TaxID=1930273 RepID=A0A517NGW3_9BACT|nr:sulfatase-like hydrolase/transferase [Rubripirellula lacrimiformis]QDT06372.1 Arylsulfatase precursor [Rubripirellula lacrimiformis]
MRLLDRVLPVLFLSVLLLPAAGVQAADKDAAAPNVIFVLCDDLGWGDFGVFYQNEAAGEKRIHTPNIDQMAAEGMQLRNHYCPAPVCAPSRSSLLTGTHQGHAEVRDNQFDKMLESNHTIASVMQQAGYRTALVGKYGLQGEGDSAKNWPAYPTRRGFDDFFGYVRHVDGHIHYPHESWPLGDSEKHRAPKEVWSNDDEVSADLAKCYTTDLFTAKSKHWIQQHTESKPDQPFFLYLAYDTPHAALQVPTGAYPDGGGLTGGVQWTGQPGRMINTAHGEIDSYRHPDYTGNGWKDVDERFATMVRRIDDCVGDLLQTLRDLNIDQNTIVVISSDNGPHAESYLQDQPYQPTAFDSFGPLDGIKRDLWEGGIRVPTLAWWPEHIPAATIDHNPSQFHDWLATFADIAGATPPARCDGVSLQPLLLGQADSHGGQVYVEYQQSGRTPNYDAFQKSRQGHRRRQQQAIFVDGMKGVRVDIQSHDDPFEIYDVVRDPGERTNLAGTSPRFDALQKTMHDRVLQVRRPNPSAPRPYDDVAIPAVEIASVVPGLDQSFFPGNFAYVPEVKSLQQIAVGTSASFTADRSMAKLDGQPAAGAIQWSGFVKVPQTGDYTFDLTSSTPSFVRIHDAILIDHDFGHEADATRSTTIRLAAGLHPIRMTSLVTDGQMPQVKLDWSGGDLSDALYRQL